MNQEYHDEIWNEIPIMAFMALGRRGREEISLEQCMIPNCNNSEVSKLHPIEKKEEIIKNEDTDWVIRIIKVKIYCESCDGIYHLNFKQTRDLKKNESDDLSNIIMEDVSASDSEDKENYGHIGYVQSR